MRRLNPRVPLGASLVAHEIRANVHRPAIRALIDRPGWTPRAILDFTQQLPVR